MRKKSSNIELAPLTNHSWAGWGEEERAEPDCCFSPHHQCVPKAYKKAAVQEEGEAWADYYQHLFEKREEAMRDMKWTLTKNDVETVVLGKKDQEVFVDAILNPPEPGEKLREAWGRVYVKSLIEKDKRIKKMLKGEETI